MNLVNTVSTNDNNKKEPIGYNKKGWKRLEKLREKDKDRMIIHFKVIIWTMNH